MTLPRARFAPMRPPIVSMGVYTPEPEPKWEEAPTPTDAQRRAEMVRDNRRLWALTVLIGGAAVVWVVMFAKVVL